MVKKLNLNAIRIDGGTQSRVEINNEVVAHYAELIKSGVALPPVNVFHDGADHWLADGFHRLHAHRHAGKASIDVEVQSGTLREALLFSFGANKGHGLQPSNADKRKIVTAMLKDAEWGAWSDAKIAKECGFSVSFVGDMRRTIFSPTKDAPAVRTVERAGKTYQQDTSRIGKAAKPEPAATTVAAQRPTPERAPWDKTPAPTNAPTTADDAFDGFDPIAELEATQKRLEEAEKRIDALTADDTKAELNKQIGIRQGIEARLSLEMAKVAQLQKELDAYGRWFAELRKVSGLEKRSEITRLVRESANARSAAV